jgi:hypothetical protein
MTEEEAKRMWCPFARVIDITGKGGGNRWDDSGKPFTSPSGSLCMASNCMAWRWQSALSDDGYCGLAGKPD